MPVIEKFKDLSALERDAAKIATILNTSLETLQKKWLPNQRIRGMAYQTLRNLGYSTSKIGKVMKRDHSTIVSASLEAKANWPARIHDLTSRMKEGINES